MEFKIAIPEVVLVVTECSDNTFKVGIRNLGRREWVLKRVWWTERLNLNLECHRASSPHRSFEPEWVHFHSVVPMGEMIGNRPRLPTLMW